MKKRHEQKLVVLGIILLFLLNVPLILVFDVQDQVLGIPILYLSIFIIWLLSVIVSYILLKKFYE